MINAYQLQTQVYDKAATGETSTDIYQELKRNKEDFRHLIKDGNPSDKETYEELKALVNNVTKEFEQAEKMGPLAQATFRLNRSRVGLAGQVLHGIYQLSPETVQDCDDIKEAANKLAQNITLDSLSDADECLGGKFQDEIRVLYGAPEKPEITGE